MRGRDTIFKTFFTIESVGVFWLIPCIFIVILVLMNFEACLVGLLGVVFPPLMLWAISEMNIPDYYFGLYCLVQFAGVLLMAGHLYYLGRKIRLRYFEMNWAQREQVRRPKSIGLYFVLAFFLGAFGAHHFYNNEKKKGIVYLVISVSSLLGGFVGLFVLLPVEMVMWILGIADVAVMLILHCADNYCRSALKGKGYGKGI